MYRIVYQTRFSFAAIEPNLQWYEKKERRIRQLNLTCISIQKRQKIGNTATYSIRLTNNLKKHCYNKIIVYRTPPIIKGGNKKRKPTQLFSLPRYRQPLNSLIYKRRATNGVCKRILLLRWHAQESRSVTGVDQSP